MKKAFKKDKSEVVSPPPSTPVVREGFLRVNRNPAEAKKEWKQCYVVLRKLHLAYYEKAKPYVRVSRPFNAVIINLSVF